MWLFSSPWESPTVQTRKEEFMNFAVCHPVIQNNRPYLILTTAGSMSMSCVSFSEGKGGPWTQCTELINTFAPMPLVPRSGRFCELWQCLSRRTRQFLNLWFSFSKKNFLFGRITAYPVKGYQWICPANVMNKVLQTKLKRLAIQQYEARSHFSQMPLLFSHDWSSIS